jgi:hypothetical protein
VQEICPLGSTWRGLQSTGGGQCCGSALPARRQSSTLPTRLGTSHRRDRCWWKGIYQYLFGQKHFGPSADLSLFVKMLPAIALNCAPSRELRPVADLKLPLARRHATLPSGAASCW